MKVTPIQALSDNYIWLYEDNNEIIVVDPGEAQPVLKYIKENQLNLDSILITHKHQDHIGGVGKLIAEFPETPLYGPSEVAEIADHIVKDGDSFERLGQTIQVMKTAGHTEEHNSFIIGELLFCGDALFSAGCGRVFTGDYHAQFEALQRFNDLSDEMKVYAGHEYTQKNLAFAQTIMPENDLVSSELERAKKLNSEGTPTLPSKIGREKEINPFMRAKSVAEFKELRDARDDF